MTRAKLSIELYFFIFLSGRRGLLLSLLKQLFPIRINIYYKPIYKYVYNEMTPVAHIVRVLYVGLAGIYTITHSPTNDVVCLCNGDLMCIHTPTQIYIMLTWPIFILPCDTIIHISIKYNKMN